MRAFNWIKKGRIFEADQPGYTHGSHPVILHKEGDRFLLGFTCRDPQQKSHIFLCEVEVSDKKIRIASDIKLAMEPGRPGHFDCDGVLTACFVRFRGRDYLYYFGWQNLPDGMWINETGRALVDGDAMTLTREFLGPVIGRDKDNPLFAGASGFFITPDDKWHVLYNSGLSWEKAEDGWRHWYGFHYASSEDGVNWDFRPGMVIPFADEYEYAFGRPSVVCWEGTYHMWFAHRASRDIETYRIGYASSTDLVSWERDDSRSGIDVSESGWDSEMICYPCVFEHKGVRYMLYNGNGYGRTGVGYAVLEEDR